jgi:carbonic anhydrase/acetyltransferase-like protein (isoleucine patch superfamily)
MDLSERLGRYLKASPRIDTTAFVHPSAVLIGDVILGPCVSIWPGAVLRGDINTISIGEGSNVQDNAVIHVADHYPCKIGKNVVIGHSAVVHACEVEDNCLIGINATVLDAAIVGEGSLVAAGAVVPPGMRIPPASLVVGVPGKILRRRTLEEIANTSHLANKYQQIAETYRLTSTAILNQEGS